MIRPVSKADGITIEVALKVPPAVVMAEEDSVVLPIFTEDTSGEIEVNVVPVMVRASGLTATIAEVITGATVVVGSNVALTVMRPAFTKPAITPWS